MDLGENRVLWLVKESFPECLAENYCVNQTQVEFIITFSSLTSWQAPRASPYSCLTLSEGAAP